jgi:hypothetical protein
MANGTIPDLMSQLIGRDPVAADEALQALASTGTAPLAGLADFLDQQRDSIILSNSARLHLAKLFGRLGEDGARILNDCIRSPNWKTARVAAHCFRHVTEPKARSAAIRAMFECLESDEPGLVKPAIVALGELGEIDAATRIANVAREHPDGAYDLDAMESLLRLIAAETSDWPLSLRFGDFNALFDRCRHKKQALTNAYFVFPEWRKRVRDSAIDLVVRCWIDNDDPDLRQLGADAVGVLRVRRVRGKLAARLQELAEQDRDDPSIARLALAWGCIGATDDASLEALKTLYASQHESLSHGAFIALSLSFADGMAVPPPQAHAAFFKRFVHDVLERGDTELTAYVLLGLARRRQMPELIRAKLASPHPLVRAAAMLALAWSGNAEAARDLRSLASDAHPASFERLIALSALAQLDPNAAVQLHDALCAMPPVELWHLRHGAEPPAPRILHPYPWMRQILYALSLAPSGDARKRAAAWGEVLVLDAGECIDECAAMAPPKVFISYSWDSEPHRGWVQQLADRLEREGVDTILDQQDLALGEPIGQFMEQAVRESDFVLCICTPRYKAKFDERHGGVGDEADLIASLYRKNPRKFIPILREGDWETATPTFFGGKLGLDLTGRAGSRRYDELFAHLFRRE